MKHAAIFSLLFAFISITAACGGNGGGERPDTATMEDETRTIEVTGTDDMTFVVSSRAEGLTLGDQSDERFLLEEITAAPGEEITIQLTTESELPAAAMSHNLVILKMGTDPDEFAQKSMTASDNGFITPDLEGSVIAMTEMLAGGESDTITFTVPEEPGEYDFLCSFPGHFAMGMRGKLIVQ